MIKFFALFLACCSLSFNLYGGCTSIASSKALEEFFRPEETSVRPNPQFFNERIFSKIVRMTKGPIDGGKVYEYASLQHWCLDCEFQFERKSEPGKIIRGRLIKVDFKQTNPEAGEPGFYGYIFLTTSGTYERIAIRDIDFDKFSVSHTPYPILPKNHPNEKSSQSARRAGIVGLKHSTRNLAALAGIFRDRILRVLTPEEYPLEAKMKRANYFSLVLPEGNPNGHIPHFWDSSAKTIDDFRPHLLFDVDLLDRDDYIVNNYLIFGKILADTIFHHEKEDLYRYLWMRSLGVSQVDEVVIQGSVSVDFVRRIYVPIGKKQITIEYLNAHGSFPPKGKTWDELIFETDGTSYWKFNADGSIQHE